MLSFKNESFMDAKEIHAGARMQPKRTFTRQIARAKTKARPPDIRHQHCPSSQRLMRGRISCGHACPDGIKYIDVRFDDPVC
jgi:hypothetical protein